MTIVSPLNLPATMPEHASQLYARNVQALLELLVDDDGELALDFDDEIIAGACVARDGEIASAVASALRRPRDADHEPDDPRARRLRRLRGDLEGAEHAAHAADVGHERDPRHRRARRHARDRPRRATASLNKLLLVIAIAFGTINVVGGFLVTDRMLEMFKRKPTPSKRRRPSSDARQLQPNRTSSQLLYIVAFSLFIYGLMGLTGPRTAVRGNRIAAVGMAIAVVATLLDARRSATGA